MTMKVPYPLVAAMSFEDRCLQMAHSIAIANERGYPRLEQQPMQEQASLSIACYGPSLLDTWQNLTPPILSMSGATRFLADHGIIADYHVDMDPRAHKAKHLDPPIPGVHYLMASVCPSQTWEILKDQRVTLWHTHCGRSKDGTLDTYGWVARHDRPGIPVVHGGSTIGLSAIHLGGLLGYRHFEIHGMDGSIREGVGRHAGPHFGHRQQDGHTWAAEGRVYQTSQIMANAVAETLNTIRHFPIFTVFHGDGLTQALVREADVPNACTVNQTEKAEKVRHYYAKIVDMPQMDTRSFQGGYWDALIDICPKDALIDLIVLQMQAERRRHKAKFSTGSIPLETALQLRAVCEYYQPRVIAEIGTFVGFSTFALRASDVLYTCDKDNDCLEPQANIRVHPHLTSTAMLQQMFADGYVNGVDLFFFDGRLVDEDIPLIEALSHPRTIYLFDDVGPDQTAKGIANLQRLKTIVPDHVLAPPSQNFGGRSTLGALLPTLPRIQEVAA